MPLLAGRHLHIYKDTHWTHALLFFLMVSSHDRMHHGITSGTNSMPEEDPVGIT